MGYLFTQLRSLGRHEPFDCTICDSDVIAEKRQGFKSIFTLKCRMCHITQNLMTESENSTIRETMDINNAVTLGCISTGIGYSELEQLAITDMPMMCYHTYATSESCVSSYIRETAWKTMEEAGREEAKLATELGEVDSQGIPCITVVTDGAWSKRSYNINYNAPSGVVSKT